jgi:serine phosphatase RsbU (regulator of sigma subunit)
VGGDIFFTRFFEDGFILAVADCTGHGVPGAFMTMITSSALQQIVKDEGCRNPAEILNRLNFNVKTLLRQDTSHALSDDGLDASIVDVRSSDGPMTLTFSGARLPLICVRNDEARVIKGDRQSIGYKRSDLDFDFTNHTLQVEKEISFYMATDGFWDQLCLDKCRCPRRRTFGKKRFVALLRENAHLSFDAQRETLIQEFNALKGDNERQDDITVVGFGLDPSA